MQFFSGFRGSGKTTELYRLKARLEASGYFVVYADALNYVNPAGELDISDLLLTLAGAFSDALEAALKLDLKDESYWSRLTSFLTRTEIEFTEVGGSIEGAELKAALKASPTFRQVLQKKMAFHLGSLKQDVHRFFEDGVKAIQKRRGADVQVVFIFDSLEQIRGSLVNQESVIHSVESIFEGHLDKLKLPYIHAVYTVPPWLKFVLPGIGNIVLLPSIRQWRNDPARTPYVQGVDALRAMVKRRLTEEGASQLFSDPSQVDRLIDVCGGHFRDLLRLLSETLLRAQSLPVPDPVLEKAIKAVRRNFLPISVEDAHWLDRIAATRLPNHRTRADVHRLARFLDSHLVLYLTNGEEWYDIHPLIREEVEKTVAHYPLETTPGNGA